MMRRVEVQRWPAVPTAPKTMAARRQVEIGLVGDDDGVVAAQLQERAAEAPGHGLRHAAAGRVEPVKEISGRRARRPP
jgi:hypothetical protein